MAATPRNRWFALLAAFAAALGGMALMVFSDDRTLRNVGVGVFIVGALVYVATRISMMRRGR